jgi:hypothetical protein
MARDFALQAFRRLLRPLVRVLLRNGVTWQEYTQLGKEVFVEVASDDYGIAGRPTNTARVALMTGLSRREVTRVKVLLAAGENRGDAPSNRISQILTAWHIDPEFLAGDARPALLPLEGAGPSIATLLGRYAGDMPHGAVVKELTQLALIEKTRRGFRVKARDYIRNAADPDLMRQAGIALHDHAATIAHNVDAGRTESARFERMATSDRLPRQQVRAFREFLASEGQAFLERIDAWLSAHSTGSGASQSARHKPVRTGVGVYLIHDDDAERQRRSA